MAALTEVEIFDCISTNLKSAADIAARLSKGERGPIFRTFTENLQKVEGACRQAAFWRDDGRWLDWAPWFARSQDLCRMWLISKNAAQNFAMLSHMLRGYYDALIILKTGKTGRIGRIMPTPMISPTNTPLPGVSNVIQFPKGLSHG